MRLQDIVLHPSVAGGDARLQQHIGTRARRRCGRILAMRRRLQ
jgi:hypothetical protein